MSQVGSLSNWYTNAYSGPFRTTRLRAPSLLPSGRPATTVTTVQQTLVVDAARQTTAHTGDKDDGKSARRRETIFGPDVGEDDEPGWTKPDEGIKVGVDVVKGWVEKAKNEEGIHATTTLQALVNLKRPTLLLQQLEVEPPASAIEDSEISPASGSRPTSMIPSPPLHLLRFSYDATTPLVSITLSIHPTPAPAVDGQEVPHEEVKTVYSGVHEGGFNQVFTLPSEAAIDLSSTIAPMPTPEEAENGAQEEKKGANVESSLVRESEDTTRSSIDRSTAMHHRNSTQPELATVPELAPADPESAEPRRQGGRRFGLFRRNNREPDVEQGQIELENRPTEGNAEEKEEQEKDKDAERGMRLLIKIEAVGPEGASLKRRNAQLTHILINGTWVPEPGSTAGPGQAGKQVWVIRVVRREAVIGAHIFLLKEIYGLSSSSTTQSTQTSYPPTSRQDDPYASTPNECIVCLTSPRDVVLLPCRHLVVCRECAVGMVEFGAGGRVARREDATGTGEGSTGDANGTAAGTAATTNNAAGGTSTAQVAGGTTATGRERRKKKPKGWYCPVCRQPYTSLLRLALPSTAKPLHTPSASRMASRAPSVRSYHTSHSHPHAEAENNSLRRVPSIAPTLPDGAERMLDSLRPARSDDEDEDEADGVEVEPVPQEKRPQFVLGDEVELEEPKQRKEVDHREVFTSSQEGDSVQRSKGGTSEDVKEEEDGKRGWKEVATDSRGNGESSGHQAPSASAGGVV